MKKKVTLFLSLFLWSSTLSFAADAVGVIIRAEGQVYSYQASTPKPHRVKVTPVPVGLDDRIQTRKESLACLKLSDGSKVVVEELSSIAFTSRTGFSNEQGTVLFDIKKSGQSRGVTVTTEVVTIGVKGTRFAVVQLDGATAIFLKEGELKLRPSRPEAMFRLRGEMEESFQEKRQALQENFEKTRSAMAAEHIEKSRQMQETFARNQAKMQQGKLNEVVEYDLDSNMAVFIDGQNLFNIAFTADWDAAFARLDSF